MEDSANAPTSPQGEQTTSSYASYVPHDLKYSPDFEDGIMAAVLNSPPAHDTGIRIIPAGSTEKPESGASIRFSDLPSLSLAQISEDELPLLLDDSRRIFASHLSGVKLTHPGGYLEGGPGLDPEMDTFAEDFVARNAHIRSPVQLLVARDKEIEGHKAHLVKKMRARREAIEKNRRIEMEVESLLERHAMERKVRSKQAEERRERRAAKEKKTAEREAAQQAVAAAEAG